MQKFHLSALLLDFLRVTEQAAIAAAHTMGQGDRKFSDRAAVESMRKTLNEIPIDGQIVIGEGERDKAPMLYIGEHVGKGSATSTTSLRKQVYDKVDIAVDPLEGTNLCATGSANSITVLAASEKGGLLNAPDMYMNKLVVGPAARGCLDINAPTGYNLKILAEKLGRHISDLVIVVLDRPRHARLVADIRTAGARIQFISDGDLSAGISAAVGGSGVHALMGIGGAPEGVITAAAMKCLNGEIQAKLVLKNELSKEDHEKLPKDNETIFRLNEMGISDPNKIYQTDDLAPGKSIIFSMTGVTDGTVLQGLRFFGKGKRTASLVMTTEPHQVRFVDTVHVEGDTVIRF